MKIWIGVAALLCVHACWLTTANAQTAAERMDNLTALYMVRASESLCGFKLTGEQRREVLKASQFIEGKLGLSKQKTDELYKQVVQSMEAQKAGGLCDPDGEWAQAFQQTADDFARPETAPDTPATSPAGAGATASAPASPPSAAQTRLTGLNAGKAILGNTISGRRDDRSFAEYYAPDGKIVALDGDEIEIGSWTLEGDTICTDFESEGKTCYRIEVLGETATFMDQDQTGFRGTILKGNAKNL